jgi:hypothetical protein
VPGTPIMPAPSRFTSATCSMLVMPLTGRLELGCAQISVPAFSGANVLRIQIGMSRPTAGAMVCGWMTLAPKYASSMASLYDSESITWASGTRRGSADSTPSTSVQIWISTASSSAPKIEAEKSLPLRPSVVCTPRGSLAMKPVTTSVSGAGIACDTAGAAAATGMSCCSLCLESCHCTAGPSAPHSTITQRRASSHCTPARTPRCLR